jgi:hypothetical protein
MLGNHYFIHVMTGDLFFVGVFGLLHEKNASIREERILEFVM